MTDVNVKPEEKLEAKGEPIQPAPPEVLAQIAAMDAADAMKKAYPKAVPIESLPTPIENAKTNQVFVKAAANGTLRAVTVDEGGLIEHLYIGASVIKAKEPTSKLEGLDQAFTGGAYLIAVVRNPDEKDVKAVKVTFWTEGGNGATNAVQGASPSAAAPSGPVQNFAVQPAQHAGLNKPGGPVTPGMNEVAVLLKYGDAQVLLQSIESGVPIYQAMAPAYIRALKDALGRL